jgi:hypothetical protein
VSIVDTLDLLQCHSPTHIAFAYCIYRKLLVPGISFSTTPSPIRPQSCRTSLAARHPCRISLAGRHPRRTSLIIHARGRGPTLCGGPSPSVECYRHRARARPPCPAPPPHVPSATSTMRVRLNSSQSRIPRRSSSHGVRLMAAPGAPSTHVVGTP